MSLLSEPISMWIVTTSLFIGGVLIILLLCYGVVALITILWQIIMQFMGIHALFCSFMLERKAHGRDARTSYANALAKHTKEDE